MKNKILNQVLILSACNIVTTSLFFFYRVLISRQISSEGMGLFTFAMTAYFLFYSFSSGGIAVSISKNIAENSNIKGYPEKVKFIIGRFVLLLSFIVTMIFLLLNGWICNNIYKTPILQNNLYPLIFCVIIVSQSAIYKGYFYGLQKPLTPALAEIFENIMRISIVSLIFMTFTLDWNKKIFVSILGIPIGEISSFSFLLIGYLIKNKSIRLSVTFSDLSKIIVDVLKISIPLAIIGILSNVFQTIENSVVPKLFQNNNINFEKAISIFGVINGMSYPVAFLPAVLITSLSTVIVPTVSELHGNKKALSRRINKFILVTIAISLPIMVIYYIYPNEICFLLFKNKEAGIYLKAIVPALSFYYLSITLSSILNALSEASFNFYQNTVISILRLASYITFLGLFRDIKWYIILTNVFAVITCIVMIGRISKVKFDFDKNIYKKIIYLTLACVIAVIISFIIPTKSILLNIITIVSVYFLFCAIIIAR
ncbi:oligosaccharide flippase family protein [Caldicellulosiruptoraceae bacterium PP1]